MKISKEVINRNSEHDFAERLKLLSNAGASLIHVRSDEVVRALLTVRQSVLVDNNTYKEWDILNGTRTFNAESMYNFNVKGDGNIDLVSALQQPMTALESIANVESDDLHYFCFVNIHNFLPNPAIEHLSQNYAHILPSSNIRIILLTPDEPLMGIITHNVITLKFKSPGHEELKGYFNDIMASLPDTTRDLVKLSEADIDKICFNAAGMTKENFEMYSSLSLVEAIAENNKSSNRNSRITVDPVVKGITMGKTEIVNKSDLLELYHEEDMSNVGGMGNLKEWIKKRKACYSDEARDFGIEAPKGLVFVGIPGVGKSLTGKAIAKEFGVPMIRLDFGKVFNSLVGESEKRIRKALEAVESMAPVVLLVDEIDKGLGGIGSSSGDSGTSSRVLGSFLTWLQDNKAPVFTVVTANNINGLPPELLRRGRFDAIFSAGLPNSKERQEVLAIHLRKRGYDIKDFKADVARFVEASKGFVPAEIESAVQDALVNAFADGEDFDLSYVIEALEDMVPLSQAFNKEIQEITLWAKQNAMQASSFSNETEVDSGTSRARRIRTKDNNVTSITKKDK